MHANLTPSQKSVWRTWARPVWEGRLTKEQAFKLRPLTDFKPSPGTLGKFMRCTHKRVLIRAPNQVGKTRHAVVKFVWQVIKDPGLYRVVGSTRKQSIDGVERELFLWIPASQLHPDSSYSPERGWTNALVKLKNGSQIQVRTNDQEVEAHAGPALKGVLMDEPPPMDKFTENIKRLNVYDGFMYLSFTPTGQDLRELRKVIEAPGSGWVQYNPQLTFEDCPWLSPERIAEILREGATDQASFRMRCFGDWDGPAKARVFTGFDSSKHVKGRDTTAKSVHEFRLCLDHGHGENRQIAILTGAALVSGFNSRARAIHAYREFASGKGVLGPPEIAAGIVAMIQDLARSAGVDPRYILGKLRAFGDSNAAGLGKRGKYNQLIEEALTDLGFPIRIETPVKVAGALQDGEALLNALALGDGLTVDPSCSALSGSLLYYEGKEEHKDPIDGLRYGHYDLLTADKHQPPNIRRG